MYSHESVCLVIWVPKLVSTRRTSDSVPLMAKKKSFLEAALCFGELRGFLGHWPVSMSGKGTFKSELFFRQYLVSKIQRDTWFHRSIYQYNL